jgi:ribonuclease BN (tRNA processing enzyme)
MRRSLLHSPLRSTLVVNAAAVIVGLISAPLLFAQVSPVPSPPARHAQILIEASPSRQVRGADVAAGVIYRDSNVVVKGFEVPHTVWPHAFGYRVETADRTIVISGDTRPSDAIARECAGCDVLLHEVYSAEGFSKIPARVQPYHSSAHTSTYELAAIATKVQPKLVVRYHQIYFSGASDDDLLREIRSRYHGRVVSAHDLDVY